MEVVDIVYKITDEFPTNERYTLTSQIIRSAVSIPSNIFTPWNKIILKMFYYTYALKSLEDKNIILVLQKN